MASAHHQRRHCQAEHRAADNSCYQRLPLCGDAVAVRAYLSKVSKTIYEKQVDELTSITVYSLGDALYDVEYSEISSDGDYTFQSKVRCQ